MACPREITTALTGLIVLHSVAATRRIEALAQSSLPSSLPSLMERAGLAVARLALATEPNARSIVVAVGPGNNGGDGLVAARHLHRAGKTVRVVSAGDIDKLPADARLACDAAQQAGVPMAASWPVTAPTLVIDALLGLGARGAPRGRLAQVWLDVQRCAAPRLAVDVPSGLDADHGNPATPSVLKARDTLTLLTVKPGLFMAQGRDACGRVWFDDLGVADVITSVEPTARLCGRDLDTMNLGRLHAQHKGSFGDVAIVGGARGMGGALVLAARAALGAGAGRVYAVGLDTIDASAAAPELMLRDLAALDDRAWLAQTTVVAGCGGGPRMIDLLPALLANAARLVLDADALNALSNNTALAQQAARRASKGLMTVLTPHPLEAARLLGLPNTASVQADRLGAAQHMAERFNSVVVLKGSGTVIATPSDLAWINPSGNALLGTAGTGDVLAGWIGGLWSTHRAWVDNTASLARLAAAAVWRHGHAGDVALAAGRQTLSASSLVKLMVDCRVDGIPTAA